MFNKIRQYLKTEIDSIKKSDPAARSSAEVVLLYPGFHAVQFHRLAHWLYNKRGFFLARFVSQGSRFITGIEIHPGAVLGKGVFIDHGVGVVIGETAEVGDYCVLYQGATLGGTGKDLGKRHPTLGSRVIVGAGAKILGPFSIGDGAKIASNAVVLKPLPAGATAVGVPARVVRLNGERVCGPLDHADIPDPVSQELERLCEEIETLKKKVKELESKREDANT